MSLPLQNHEEEAIAAALEMIAAVRKIDENNLRLRVGIASGPLIGITSSSPSCPLQLTLFFQLASLELRNGYASLLFVYLF